MLELIVKWLMAGLVGLLSLALSLFVYHVQMVTTAVQNNTASNVAQRVTNEKLLVVLDNLDESVDGLLRYQQRHEKESVEGFNRIRCIERETDHCPDAPVSR